MFPAIFITLGTDKSDHVMCYILVCNTPIIKQCFGMFNKHPKNYGNQIILKADLLEARRGDCCPRRGCR
jgi:hypothetical protein